MEWGEDCQHGVKWQDNHHKLLFNNINKLLDSIVTGSNNKESFDETVKFIERYSLEHFNSEELYMNKHGYPRKENHVNEHKRFIEDFQSFVDESRYQGIESSVELLNKLNDWFYNHTQTTDKFLAKFLLKHNIK